MGMLNLMSSARGYSPGFAVCEQRSCSSDTEGVCFKLYRRDGAAEMPLCPFVEFVLASIEGIFLVEMQARLVVENSKLLNPRTDVRLNITKLPQKYVEVKLQADLQCVESTALK